jgi:hypothetical protein
MDNLQREWLQQVYMGRKLIKEIKRVNTIGERQSHPARCAKTYDKITVRTEFVEPGVWVSKNGN